MILSVTSGWVKAGGEGKLKVSNSETVVVGVSCAIEMITFVF